MEISCHDLCVPVDIYRSLVISAKWTEWNWRIYCFHLCLSVSVCVCTHSVKFSTFSPDLHKSETSIGSDYIDNGRWNILRATEDQKRRPKFCRRQLKKVSDGVDWITMGTRRVLSPRRRQPSIKYWRQRFTTFWLSLPHRVDYEFWMRKIVVHARD